MTVLIILLVVLLIAALLIFLLRNQTDILGGAEAEIIEVTSAAFEDCGAIPVAYTGNGEDISPPFQLGEMAEGAKSMAIIMEDLDVPFVGNLTHWTIWNLPAQATIAEAIPAGERVEALGGAVQGMGYGQHQYRGPKPPFGSHRYQFHFFILDEMLALEPAAGKKELRAAMEGHILQYGTITGWYPQAK